MGGDYTQKARIHTESWYRLHAMSAVAPEQITPIAAPSDSVAMRHGRLLALWLAALVPLLIAVGGNPVQRTQEARVVETARQMLGRGFHAWLIPSINGEIRLRKPPLAYWMAAASFSLLGVSEFAARLPTVLTAWLTLAATYAIAARLFGHRAGLLSGACLLSSYLFFKMGRLAETDGPATLWATIAVGFYWWSIEAKPSQRGMFFHAAAIATGLSLFAKQGPGFFPLFFFVVFSFLRRRPKTLWRFVLSGAPITLIVFAGWWYGYAAAVRGIAQFRRELAEVTEGLDHPAPFYDYAPMLLLAAAPWSIVAIGAVVASAKRAARHPGLAGLLVWSAACFIPLCFVGNKQEHYLLPMMPPLMILTGWLIDEACRAGADERLSRSVAALIGATVVASIIAPIGLLIAAHLYRGNILPLDIAFAAAVAFAAAAAWIILIRRGAATAAFTLAAIWSLTIPLLIGLWGPAIESADIRSTAAQISNQFGRGPFVFFGGDTSMPLCFALREEIPRIDDQRPDLLLQAAQQTPTLAVIWEIPQAGRGANLPPAQFEQVGPDFGAKGQHFRIFQKNPPAN